MVSFYVANLLKSHDHIILMEVEFRCLETPSPLFKT